MTNQARAAIVTGTSSGIGAAVARQLVDCGWTVIGCSRRTASFGSDTYHHVSLDLADVGAACDVFERTVARIVNGRDWSRIALVNNAATGSAIGPVERISPDELQSLFAVNVTMPVWLMGFVLRHGRPEAARRIVNVSSGAAVRAFPGLGAYCSSKAALRMAGMVLAAEFDTPQRQHRIADLAVLSYEPGVVDTEMQIRTRAHSHEAFPWVDVFLNFERSGMLMPPGAPAAEIVAFVDSDPSSAFSERRFGRRP